MESRRRLGQLSETLVADEMIRRGYQVLTRNYQIKQGELDIIARRSREIVVVEVRSRRNDRGDEALESVQAGKQAKVRRTAQCYLALRPIDYEEVRFFLATVNWVDDRPHIEIIEDAF